MRVLGNYCRLGEVRTHIRVGVVGKAVQISRVLGEGRREGVWNFVLFGRGRLGFRSGCAICSLAGGHGKAYSDSQPLEPNMMSNTRGCQSYGREV